MTWPELELWNWAEAQKAVEPLPAFAKNSDTSVAAAESMRGETSRLRALVLAVIRQNGETGATCDEVELATGLRHQTASARVNELMNRGQIVDTEQRRRTRSGRFATVWRAK